jgi:uncharacterized peroxidase-related enzyme
MSWIRSIAPEQATGATAEAYAKLRERSSRPHVSHVWQALALDPRGLTGLFGLRSDLMDDPAPLTLAQAVAIVLVVSATNGCAYCVAHHGPKLARALGSEPLARAVATDYREADLPARDRVLLDYAVALTCEPAERKQEDVERLREYGFDDAAILKVTEITAYYNAVNRVVCGLGVQLEDGVAPWEFGAQR